MIDTPGDSRSAFFSRAANLALLFRTARIPRARYASKNQNCPRERRNGCDYNNRSGYPDLIRASVLTRRRLRPMEATANAHSHLKRAKALPSLPITLSGAPGFSRTIACRVHRCALGLRHDNRGMRIPSEGRRTGMSSSMIRQLFATRAVQCRVATQSIPPALAS
jgi:hypothetical protein